MDKYEFLKICAEYGGFPREMYIDYGEQITETYNRLVDNGEITVFHGFFCLVSSKLHDNVYALVPYTGSYEELQNDKAFTEYHSWRAEAERHICDFCGKIYFSSNKNDVCPYCVKK